MFIQINKIIKNKKRQATVEYLLILVSIAIVVIIGLNNIAGELVNFFNDFITKISFG
ncbi:MAG: hypothetical protein PWP27_1365 [Clostridiales bacterium]|jgi:Flp pilus assembly pilin Flp|nr:hypothetical protein [Clostridiales bacterium]MDK2933555.1 hypothetical protein [Clostridiales bacterium]